ncbi:MAG: hypothetical protein LBC85_01105, partial [Fibromonadaceae bacterium]|nr:hypothetical protein [Fibromonadaceae bacterium]
YTATAVAKLKAVGAVILTDCNDIALAVANGTVALALGSDTGGCIRRPAASAGIVGIKPTYGRVSRYGLVAYASSLEQIGVFSSCVKNLAPILGVICGQDAKDNTSSPQPAGDFGEYIGKGVKGKIIGVPKDYAENTEAALSKLEKEGAILKELSLPSLRYAVETYEIISAAEASSNFSRFNGISFGRRSKEAKGLMDTYLKSRSEGFDSEVKFRIMLGNFVLSSGSYKAYYVQAQKMRRVITEEFKKAFSQCDVLATTAPLSQHAALVGVNLAGLPGLVQPCGKAPAALQWVGKPFDEASLLGIADTLACLEE